MGHRRELDDEVAAWRAARDELFRNPSLEKAKAFLPAPPGGWLDPEGALAAVHKGRLQWLEATDAQLAESIGWLEARGYCTSWEGAEALTPQRRDADRAILGKGPLKDGG